MPIVCNVETCCEAVKAPDFMQDAIGMTHTLLFTP